MFTHVLLLPHVYAPEQVRVVHELHGRLVKVFVRAVVIARKGISDGVDLELDGAWKRDKDGEGEK